MKHSALRLLLTISLLFSLTSLAVAQPHWLWSRAKGQARGGEVVFFRKAFVVEGAVTKAELFASCDNRMDVYLNGKLVVQSGEWQRPVLVDVTKHVRSGENLLAVRGQNDGGNIAAFLARLTLSLAADKKDDKKDDKKQEILTDPSWRITDKLVEGWQTAALDDSQWVAPVSQGTLGVAPWGDLTGGGPGQKLGAPRKPGQATPVEQITVLPDFHVELLYSVPKATHGSWVAITNDTQGRLIVSDQGGAGLFRVTPPPIGLEDGKTEVEKIDVDLSGAQGLVWAFDSLYVHRSGGLYRVTDTDGDDRLDTAELLMKDSGGGEHGVHAVIRGAGDSLLTDGGNHSDMPAETDRGRFPGGWAEDLLLPRQWDARGHARGRMAPGGWVCQVSPDGSQWELLGVGYRNQYDIAMNRHGELFTFDADMEWDFGMPWYRPTRICHVTSGSNYGWRSGTGKWPTYYEDSLPPTLDIGPGSPVGVLFGTGAKFPAKYQDALFALDWTFGTIYALHLEPHGAGYRAVKEDFLFGTPLPLTDGVIGDDGAFYFTIGGRGTQSGLYRVTYRGEQSTQPASGEGDPVAAAARQLRHQLESFHGRENPAALDTAWPHLSSEDRFLRCAARVAIESQPVDSWQSRALIEKNPQARVTAAVALSHVAPQQTQAALVESLLELDPTTLDQSQTLGLLRAYALCFIRLGEPSREQADKVIGQLVPSFPTESDPINTELVRLMVYLDAPDVVEKTLQLMTDAKPQPIPDWAELIGRNGGYGGTIRRMLDDHPPTNKIAYAFMLRNVRYGWSLSQRRTYFEFINEAAKHPGGASYSGFLKNIRADALLNCSEAERAALASLTGETLDPPPPFEVTQPEGPGRQWTTTEALAAMNDGLHGRDFQSGRNLFYATKCAACHLFDGYGGDVGPDLSTVRNKFSHNDLLEAIVEPSKVISDQFHSHIILTEQGKTLEGLVVDTSAEGDDNPDTILEVYLSDPDEPPVRLKRSDIDEMEISKQSQMPTGLIDSLSPEELRDLIAYLLSQGNANSPEFQQE